MQQGSVRASTAYQVGLLQLKHCNDTQTRYPYFPLSSRNSLSTCPSHIPAISQTASSERVRCVSHFRPRYITNFGVRLGSELIYSASPRASIWARSMTLSHRSFSRQTATSLHFPEQYIQAGRIFPSGYFMRIRFTTSFFARAESRARA